MELSKVNGDEFELFVPLSKINEKTGEFTAWATLEEIDQSGEIIDLDKSWPYFEALAARFSEVTKGANFGPLREQHDPNKAAGHLIAPPVIKTHSSGVRGIEINGLITDDGTQKKLNAKTLTGVSIGGKYVGEPEMVKIGDRDAKKFVADPNHYGVVDSPCVKNALVTVIKADGSEKVEPLVGFNPQQGFECRGGAFHVKKDDARKCGSDHGLVKAMHLRKDDLAGGNGGARGEDTAPTAARVTAADGLRAANDKKKKKTGVGAASTAVCQSCGAAMKSENDGLLEKCLQCVAQLAGIISNSESLIRWLEIFEADDDGDTAELEIADQIEAANAMLYEALHGLVDDAQSDAQGDEAEEGNAPDTAAAIAAVTDNAPVMQMTALAASLKKQSTLRKLLTKSLHVHTGNGSRPTSTEDIMEKSEKQKADEAKAAKLVKAMQCACCKAGDCTDCATMKGNSCSCQSDCPGCEADDCAGMTSMKSVSGGELSKAATDQIAKAVSDGLGKMLEPVTAKVDAIEKSQSESDKVVDRLVKAVGSIINKPADTRAVKRVTKAEDSKGDPTDHGKAAKTEKEKTAFEKMAEVIGGRPMQYNGGRLESLDAE